MAEKEQQEELDKNKRIRPREQAHGQKYYVCISCVCIDNLLVHVSVNCQFTQFQF